MADETDGGATTDPGGWFETAGFGLFVHWGLFSAKGLEPSWPLVGGSTAFPFGQDVLVAEYYDRSERWSPVADAPREWLSAARAAHMQYAVMTTKHHDGFALFDCPATDFGIGRNEPGRDLTREFVDACRAEGLRVGLYYSLSDWHHVDYPAFTDGMRPYPMIAYPRADAEGWSRYLADLHAQLDHLLTAYGPIDVLWFDGGWERGGDEWGSLELEGFIRARQPDILINDRLPWVGDFSTPEQAVPLADVGRPWETCLTMNHSWGPVAEDTERKSARQLVSILADVVAGGGNLLLNLSPDGDGHLLAWQRERLDAVAAWMDRHHEAIIGARPGVGANRFYGPSTRSGDRLFLLCPGRPVEFVTLRAVPAGHIAAVRALGTGTVLDVDMRLSALDRILGTDPVCDVVIAVPDDACDDLMTVIEVTFDGEVAW